MYSHLSTIVIYLGTKIVHPFCNLLPQLSLSTFIELGLIDIAISNVRYLCSMPDYSTSNDQTQYGYKNV